MAAHRYWKALALEAYGSGDIELSCFHLLDVAGARLDSTAALTASTAPDVGSVANLQDDDLTTAARWSAQSIASLSLVWDFGASPVDVSDIRLAGDSSTRFPLVVKIQYSDDAGVWADADVLSGITWPGVQTKTLSDTAARSRFWRVYITANNGDAGYTSMQEIELRNSGVDQTNPSMSCGQSSYFHPDNALANKLFDNNLTDYVTSVWENGIGAVLPHWVSIDTGGVIEVSEVAIWPQNYSPLMARAPKDFEIQISNNGVSWDTLAAFTDVTGWSAGTVKTFPIVGKVLIRRNVVRGRCVLSDALSVGTGPAMIYGIPLLDDPVHLGVESGSIKDLITGVLGQGLGRVKGHVKNTPSIPVYRKVRLIRERDSLLIRELWSDPITGAYDFKYVDELQKYTILGYDHTGSYNGVIAANVTPELMT